MAGEFDGTGEPSEGWEACPPGEFGRLGQRLQARRRRRSFLRAASLATAASAFGGAVAWLGLSASGPADVRDITCAEVQQAAQPYLKGQLDPALRECIRQHIAHCPLCGPRFNQKPAANRQSAPSKLA